MIPSLFQGSNKGLPQSHVFKPYTKSNQKLYVGDKAEQTPNKADGCLQGVGQGSTPLSPLPVPRSRSTSDIYAGQTALLLSAVSVRAIYRDSVNEPRQVDRAHLKKYKATQPCLLRDRDQSPNDASPVPTLDMRSVREYDSLIAGYTLTILPHLYVVDEGNVADLFQARRQDARETLAQGVHGEDNCSALYTMICRMLAWGRCLDA